LKSGAGKYGCAQALQARWKTAILAVSAGRLPAGVLDELEARPPKSGWKPDFRL